MDLDENSNESGSVAAVNDGADSTTVSTEAAALITAPQIAQESVSIATDLAENINTGLAPYIPKIDQDINIVLVPDLFSGSAVFAGSIDETDEREGVPFYLLSATAPDDELPAEEESVDLSADAVNSVAAVDIGETDAADSVSQLPDGSIPIEEAFAESSMPSYGGTLSLQSLQGITEPYKDSLLSATVEGRITVIKVDEGDVVKAGDIILELENEQETLEVARRELIAKSKVEVESAKARMDTLKFDYDSARKLYKANKAISQQELMEKELEFKMARAEYNAYLMAEQREQIEHKIAQAELNKRMIKAPFDAIIAKLYFEVGENCHPQEPLVRIVDTSRCKFIGYMSADTNQRLAPGMWVNVHVENDAARAYPGVVEYISPVIDPSSGLQELEVLFDNQDSLVCPGVNATVSLVQHDR